MRSMNTGETSGQGRNQKEVSTVLKFGPGPFSYISSLVHDGVTTVFTYTRDATIRDGWVTPAPQGRLLKTHARYIHTVTQ